MILLIFGLLMWVGLHFIPSLAIPFRKRLIDSLGEKPYSLVFSLLVVSSIALMVFGWRSIEPANIYALPAWSRPLTILLILITFILFSAAHAKTSIRRLIRHPQLIGLVFWSIGHLLSNGDNRSLVLFGTLGVWAIMEIILINKREGVWVKPEPASFKSEVLMLVKGFVIFAVFMFLHPYIAGAPVIPH